MARKQKTKSRPASRGKRVANRKAAAQASNNSWQAGAAIFALAAVLGAGAYLLSITLESRTTVAELVERFEVPGTAKQQIPAGENAGLESGPIESAPKR